MENNGNILLGILANILEDYTERNYERMKLNIGELVVTFNSSVNSSKDEKFLEYMEFTKDHMDDCMSSYQFFSSAYTETLNNVFSLYHLHKAGITNPSTLFSCYRDVFWSMYSLVGYINYESIEASSTMSSLVDLYRETK